MCRSETRSRPARAAGTRTERPGLGRGKLKVRGEVDLVYVYVNLEVFSRYIVGWTVQFRENAQLAMGLIEQATEQQQTA